MLLEKELYAKYLKISALLPQIWNKTDSIDVCIRKHSTIFVKFITTRPKV